MAKVSITFDTDSAAFDGDNYRDEVLAVLRRITDKITTGESDGVVRDVNGNHIGNWYMDGPESDDVEEDEEDFEPHEDTPSLDTSFHDHEMDV